MEVKMRIYFNYQPEYLYDALHELIRMAYPEALLLRENAGDADIEISIGLNEGRSLLVYGSIKDIRQETKDSQRFELNVSDAVLRNEIKKCARIFTYKLLEKHFGKSVNNYGILTGMRPVKLVHRLIDQGLNEQQIVEQLKNEYLLREDKARLLSEVALNERPYLLDQKDARKLISVYIGIPYCPGRCSYCSFSGAVLHDYDRDLKPFLAALEKEIITLGQVINELGLSVQSIYVGGGTPTVLCMEDMNRLFALLYKMYISSQTVEITVEAGRPDTLNQAKMAQLKKLGVDRVCINPQTMHNATLLKIGRNHNMEGVVLSVGWAREAGIEKINMDLIVGLPGESLRENMYTAEKILLLQPENVTVHTLAIKRGSQMAEWGKGTSNSLRVKEVQEGVDYFSNTLRQAGYLPYYLYRQKYMRASMENTGYSLKGHICLYNVQMIEERQTIVGLGGGGASKFINPEDWSLTSLYNPRNPLSYIENVEELIRRKVDKLKALN